MEPLDSYIQPLNHLFEQGLIDTHHSLLTLKAGEVVFHAEEPAEKIFGVKTGKIQLVRYLDNGQSSYQCSVQTGVWFGETSLNKDVYANSAIATEPSQVIAISKQAFLTLLGHNPEVSLLFIEQLTEQLHTARNLMTLRCIRSATDRVLAYLHSLKPAGQNTCVLKSPLKVVAEHICLTPEVVSRSLRKLQDEGIIQRDQRKITFLRG